MHTLEVKNLSKRYGKKQALSGVNITFKTGINALLGANGAGKTTIMNCISGVIKTSGGEVEYDGEDVFKMGERYREKISFQFQSQPFYPSYTAYEFLKLAAILKGIDKQNTDSEIMRVLSLVNLSENINDKIKSFSGGMRQRLAIAQTILGSPEILIFDEPSAGLDPFEREQFKRIMVSLKDCCIIIISTHIVSDIDTITDELIILDKGSVAANDKPENLYSKIDKLVWQIPSEERELLPFEKLYFEDSSCKTISRNKPTPNAKQCAPTINDLFFCGQGGRGILGGEDK
ncbi:MAG: ATP-binding cassette domain-containing protein [Ruminococcus sp.]|nr:ATP-binding cassette domain-containing protein [Ruminococcus sp.]